MNAPSAAIVGVVLSAILAAQETPAKQATKIDEFKMITYQAVFVTKGPAWNDAHPEKMRTLANEHRAYIADLLRTGKAAIGGPFAGDGHLRGVYIVQGSPEQARELAEADPGVKARVWALEILPWMGPEGWFRKPPDVSNTETIYFGFLVTGPNRAQDKETAQALQRQHLDYMDGQAKLGRLVLAGPLNAPQTPRRGLVAYRAGSMQEAMTWASGDPMVKAGRLAVEMYEWRIPSGILR
jgi:uncharacterized protein YciI